MIYNFQKRMIHLYKLKVNKAPIAFFIYYKNHIISIAIDKVKATGSKFFGMDD